MTERTTLVTPSPELFGGRVTPWTPLGHVIAVFRRLNPDVAYADLKAAAEAFRRGPVDEPDSTVDVTTFEDPEPVVMPVRAARKATPRKRSPRNEAEASMVPVEGGEPIPAEPPTRW